MLLYAFMYNVTYSAKGQRKFWIAWYAVVAGLYLTGVLVHAIDLDRAYIRHYAVRENTFASEMFGIPLTTLYLIYIHRKNAKLKW